jgi:hypothetical protein
MPDLIALRPLILGPLRDHILEFEGSDWCCRQSAIYVTKILRHFGHKAALVEGRVTIEAVGDYSYLGINHAWVLLPSEGTLIDLTLTQANYTLPGTAPVQEILPIWGQDPHYVSRDIRMILTEDHLERLMLMEHWCKPGLLYRDICAEMIDYFTELAVPAYA